MLLVFGGAATQILHAQDNTQRPAGAGRVVKAFDFEEQEINPLPVPLGWVRAQNDPAVPRDRPGFPIWNGAILDYSSRAFGGIGSVMLPTNGGSTSLMLRHGELSIFPNTDYLVSVCIRTERIKHARARLVAVLLDQQGDPIESSRTYSKLVRSASDWERVAIEVEGIDSNAAYMQLELQLLQPEHQDTQDQLDFRVWDQDFEGAAWFDNLIIAQLPRLEVTTGTPGNIVESVKSPRLQLVVRDLTGDTIFTQLRIFDVHDTLVDRRIVGDGARGSEIYTNTNLPGFGWYRALLEVFVDQRLVGVRTLDFIWAPPIVDDLHSGMFGIESSLTDPKLLDATPALLKGSGVDRATVSVWNITTTLEQLQDESPLFQTLESLLRSGTSLSFELAKLPQPLATQIASDTHEVLFAFREPTGPWNDWGSLILDRFGQRVSTWTFGNLPSEEPPALLFESIKDARQAIAGFVPGPVASVAWPIDRPIPSELAVPGIKLKLIDNHSVTPEGIGQLVEHWDRIRTPSDGTDAPTPGLGLQLQPIEHPSIRTGTQTWSALGSLARKAISFWWAAKKSNAQEQDFSLSLRNAWWVAPGKRGQVMPASELIVWRTLSTHLGGRDAIEALDLIPGVKMLVVSNKPSPLGEHTEAQDNHTGGMILWLEEPTLDPVVLSMPLGLHTVNVYDVLGNSTQVEPIREGNIDAPTHHIPITRSPILVEGINPELVRFMCSLKLSPDTLESRSGLHQHDLVMSNPWDIAISGNIYIVEPGGYTGNPEDIDRSWDINPRVIPFNLAPMQSRSFEINIGYSLGELAGQKRLVFDVDLDADQGYPTVRIEREIELGLPDIDMELTVRRNASGITVVSALVSHELEQEQYFDMIAIAPGEPRIRRTINALSAGQSATRQFAFTHTKPGDEVVVILMPRDSTTRLNKSVVVP